MTLTKPAFAWSHTLTAVTHIVVRYTDATTQNVSLSAGSYPALPGLGGLCVQLALDLNADATNGGTWTVTFSTTTYKIVILSTGGAKTPDRLTFSTAELTPYDLGFAPDSGTTIVDDDAAAAGQFTAEWPMRRLWAPNEYLTDRIVRIDDVVAMRRSRYSGRIVAEKRSTSGGIALYEYVLPFVPGPRVFGFAADDTSLSALDGLVTAGDPNVSLDRFRERYMAGIASNALPRARAVPDITAPTTYDDVVLFADQPEFADVADPARSLQAPFLVPVRLRAAAWVAP